MRPDAAEQPESDEGERLAGMRTDWGLVAQAHRGSASALSTARHALVLRYRGAIRAYLGALLKDEAAADELSQEFVVRLLSGDFAGASHEKGRFRNYLKAAVRNLARSYWEEQHRRPTLAADPAALSAAAGDDLDARWNEDWRQTVLRAAWAALKEHEREHPASLCHSLLKLRGQAPELDSKGLAERLSAIAGVTITPANARQLLHRARSLFARQLVEESARALENPTRELVEQELAELRLIDYVRDFMPADWSQIRGAAR